MFLTNEKLRGVPTGRVVYVPRPTDDFCLELALAHGATSPGVVCQTAKGDLRQIGILAVQDKAAGDGVGLTDAAPHAWRDTRAVLGGAPVPEERLCVAYVEANALAGMPEQRLDDAAAMYGTLAQLDASGAFGTGGCGVQSAMELCSSEGAGRRQR